MDVFRGGGQNSNSAAEAAAYKSIYNITALGNAEKAGYGEDKKGR